MIVVRRESDHFETFAHSSWKRQHHRLAGKLHAVGERLIGGDSRDNVRCRSRSENAPGGKARDAQASRTRRLRYCSEVHPRTDVLDTHRE